MFDIGAGEVLVIAVVAILVIGPKDMPMALRTAGRWIGQVRRMSNHFRAGIDAMIREAEMEEMEKKWQERNAQIMRAHPGDEMTPLPPAPPEGAVDGDSAPDPEADDPAPAALPTPAASAEARAARVTDTPDDKVEPQLPLDSDGASGAEPAKKGKA
tara:strand:+ start:309 stop:779 length:471 start_codon:yes stop_codon:yes gene_type:complete